MFLKFWESSWSVSASFVYVEKNKNQTHGMVYNSHVMNDGDKRRGNERFMNYL